MPSIRFFALRSCLRSGRFLFVIILIVSLLTGCSPRAVIDNEFESRNLITLAVLPIIDDTELPEEELLQVYHSLEQELRNVGFLVLDANITKDVCSTAPCEQSERLFSQYLVDATAQLSLKTSSRNDFLLGYFNVLSGSIVIEGKNNYQLLKAAATQRERGGLLFNSGQVLQGFISQFTNADQGSSDRFLDKFLKSLIAQVPKRVGSLQDQADATTVAISSVEVEPMAQDVRQICVSATPQSLVSILIDRTKTLLPEIKPGNYCRTMLLSPPFKYKSVTVEARTHFGNSVRQEVILAEADPCTSPSLITIDSLAPNPKLIFQCAALPRKKMRTFLVFREEEGGLRYQKIATTNSSSWIDNSSTNAKQTNYVVIERSSQGDLSLPLLVSGNNGN